MNKGDKLIMSEDANSQGIGQNYTEIVCIKPPNVEGIVQIEHKGIKNPKNRVRISLHESFLEAIK